MTLENAINLLQKVQNGEELTSEEKRQLKIAFELLKKNSLKKP